MKLLKIITLIIMLSIVSCDETDYPYFINNASFSYTYDAAADFSATSNPAGAWSYGYEIPSDRIFRLYEVMDISNEREN